MLNIIDYAINRQRAVLALLVVLMVAGMVARSMLPEAAEPEVDVPFVRVSVFYQGAAPDDMERLVTRPIEQEMRSVEGLKEMHSYTRLSITSMFLEFDVAIPAEIALDRARLALDRVKPKLPTEADEPFIDNLSVTDAPIIIVSFASQTVPARELYSIARRFKLELEHISQVLAVDVSGTRERQVEVVVRRERMEALGLSIQTLYDLVASNNRLITAGRLDSGEGAFNIQVPGVVNDVRDLLAIPLKTADGSTIVLGDVAEVRDGFKDASSYARINGRPTVSLLVTRRQGSFLLETVQAVQDRVDDMKGGLPPGVEVLYTRNQAPEAKATVSQLQGNILTAILLVMTVVVGALGLRSAGLVGVGVPFSMLVSFIALVILDYSFNFMVMFGFLLAMGMLIDGSVVIVEYADRKMSEGAQPTEAYREAARRMFWPVAASVATTLAAFLPLFFWPGVSGKFMRYLPVTAATVLASSLLYALLFLPALGARFGRPALGTEEALSRVRELEHGDPRKLGGLVGIYARFMKGLLEIPGRTLLISFGVLLLIFKVYWDHNRGLQFFIDLEPQLLNVEVRARGNLAGDELRDLMVRVEERLLRAPAVQEVYLQTGSRRHNSPPDTIGLLYVELIPFRQRVLSGDTILKEMRASVRDLPGIIVTINEEERGPPVGSAIEVEMSSDNRALIEQQVVLVEAKLSSMEGLRDVDSTLPLPTIEWRLQVDKARAHELGVNLTEAGSMVQLVTNGLLITKYRPVDYDDEVDIRLRFDSRQRTLKGIENLQISTASGTAVPLSSFSSFQPVRGVSTLHRVAGRSVYTVTAGVEPDVQPSSKMSELRQWLAESGIDPRVSVRLRGSDEHEREASQFLGAASLAALLLMLLMLIIQFNSFYQAVLILSAVVMSVAGVLLGTLIRGDTFSIIMTGVAVIALAGIVVNNNIVLIDTYNHLRREQPGIPHHEIVLRTCVQRLRPVLLTTGTTILGLLPISLHLSIDFVARTVEYGGETAGWWVQMASAIVWGLGFSTLLTLIVTPAALHAPYLLRSNWRAMRLRRYQRRQAVQLSG